MIRPFRELGRNSLGCSIGFNMKNYSCTKGSAFLKKGTDLGGLAQPKSLGRFSGIGLGKKAPSVYHSSEPILA